MPSFKVRSRTTGPLTDRDVDAETRDEAIAQVVADCPDDGSQIEVLRVEELVESGTEATGAKSASHKKEEPHHSKRDK